MSERDLRLGSLDKRADALGLGSIGGGGEKGVNEYPFDGEYRAVACVGCLHMVQSEEIKMAQ
jgi:hypothetical protein